MLFLLQLLIYKNGPIKIKHCVENQKAKPYNKNHKPLKLLKIPHPFK